MNSIIRYFLLFTYEAILFNNFFYKLHSCTLCRMVIKARAEKLKRTQ